MATPAQITANRLNSLKSTGPRTEEGKAASSANALKHGLTALKVFPAERQAEYDELARGLREELQPSTPEEERIFDTLVFAAWNQRRLFELHEELWHTLTQGDEPKSMAQAFVDDCKGPRSVDKLYRYMRDLQRTFDRAKAEYKKAVEQRPAQTTAAAAAPEIGFVSSPRPPALPVATDGSARSRYVVRGDEPPALRL